MKVVKKSFYQNYFIENPVIGSIIMTLYFWLFSLLYQPFQFDHNTHLPFALSLFIFSLGGSITYLGFISLIKFLLPAFFEKRNWTVFKEGLAILSSLVVMGITIFALGFVLNIETGSTSFSGIIYGLTDAIKMVSLIGIIPFAIASVKNIGRPYISTHNADSTNPDDSLIEIQSALKEKLLISVKDLIYIISNGNYVDFYIIENEKLIRKTLRNSLNNIEKQLVDFPYCIRTHRAFIVNMNYVQNKIGNAQGYRLKLKNSQDEIPVSRNKIAEFDLAFQKNHS